MSSSRVLAPLSRPARPARGLRAAAVVSALVLGAAACGDDGADAGGDGNPELDAITVEGAFGEKPEVTFEAPFELEESQSEVLVVGDGDEVEADDTVTIDYVIHSGTDASELDTSFGASTVSLPLTEGQTTPALIDAVVGQPLGSRVLVAVAPEAETAEAPDPAGSETIVFVLDLLSVVPDRADGEPVEQPEGTPVVQTDDEDNVTGIDVEGVEAPAELTVTPVLQGDGTEVQAGDNVTIHYTGVLADGTPFDSSWDRGSPTSFPLTNLIAGWQQGLEGVAVGSRVVLQVPPELGYGEAGSPPTIPENADLVFVIDVLDTQSAPEAPEAPEPEPSE